MICIFGGTFDPVHFGHLRPALEVGQTLGVSCVHLLPCGVPPHRDPPFASAEQRLALLQAAVNDEPGLAVDQRELLRPGPSYMVDTLASIRAEIGVESLCLVLGMDAFRGLTSWHDWERIPVLAHVVVMQRPGSEWPCEGSLGEWIRHSLVDDKGVLHERSAGAIFGVPVTQLAISSTQIRTLLTAGKSPRYLLPDKVLDRIRRENWYAK